MNVPPRTNTISIPNCDHSDASACVCPPPQRTRAQTTYKTNSAGNTALINPLLISVYLVIASAFTCEI